MSSEDWAVREIRKGVRLLKRQVGDNKRDGRSHSAEDAIHQTALRLIAGGAEKPAEIAKAALETLDLDFPRWYE